MLSGGDLKFAHNIVPIFPLQATVPLHRSQSFTLMCGCTPWRVNEDLHDVLRHTVLHKTVHIVHCSRTHGGHCNVLVVFRIYQILPVERHLFDKSVWSRPCGPSRRFLRRFGGVTLTGHRQRFAYSTAAGTHSQNFTRSRISQSTMCCSELIASLGEMLMWSSVPVPVWKFHLPPVMFHVLVELEALFWISVLRHLQRGWISLDLTGINVLLGSSTSARNLEPPEATISYTESYQARD